MAKKKPLNKTKSLDFQDVLRTSWRHGYKASLTSGLEPAFFTIKKPDNYQERMNKAIELGVLVELEEKFSSERIEITDQMDAFLAENEDEMLKLIFDDSGGAMAIERQKAIFNC